VVQRPLPENDPLQRQPDITRARTLLGWQPSVPLAEGLERTVGYFRQLAATAHEQELDSVRARAL
jgi:dTDP-glucose 4,6-dehydratase